MSIGTSISSLGAGVPPSERNERSGPALWGPFRPLHHGPILSPPRPDEEIKFLVESINNDFGLREAPQARRHGK